MHSYISDMKVYLVTLCVVFVFAYCVNRTRYIDELGKVKDTVIGNMAAFLCAACLIFVAGFRYNVGTDYAVYFLGYESRKNQWLQSVLLFDEPGINIIAKLGSFIYDNAVTMFFISSVITVGLCMLTIKKYSIDFCFSVLLFIFIGCWSGSFNGVRQYLAMAIIFAGHKYIYKQEFIKYLLVVFMAMCFHKTAIIMLPIYFIARKKINIKTILIVVAGTVIIRYSYEYIFSAISFLRGAETSQNFSYALSSVNPLRIAVTFAPLVLALMGINNNKIKNEECQFYIMLLIINAAFSFATVGSAYLARATIYTEIYAVLAYPRLVECFTKQSKKLAIILICICYFGYWIYGMNANGFSNFMWAFGNI